MGGKWAEYDEVIGWIHAAGGKAVLAHPLRYRMTNTKVRRLLNHLSGAGLDGVEVVTGSSSSDEITLVSQWAKEFDLLSSIGSDYHGWPNQRVRIGHLQDMPQVNEMVWKDSSWLN